MIWNDVNMMELQVGQFLAIAGCLCFCRISTYFYSVVALWCNVSSVLGSNPMSALGPPVWSFHDLLSSVWVSSGYAGFPSASTSG